MTSHIVRERLGLPVWDGDRVVDTVHKNVGDTVTTEELKAAGQSKEEIDMLVQYNCERA